MGCAYVVLLVFNTSYVVQWAAVWWFCTYSIALSRFSGLLYGGSVHIQ